MSTQTTVADEVEEKQGSAVEVDINDTSLPDGEEEELNQDGDFQAIAVPPPDGKYQVQVYLAEKINETAPVMQDKTYDGKVFYTINMEARIRQPADWEGGMLSGKCNTLIQKRTGTSSAAGMIKLLDPTYKLPSKVTPLSVMRALVEILNKGPKCFVETEWRAWSFTEKNGKDMQGKPRVGKHIKKGMKQFPQIAGKHYPIVKDSDGNDCKANAKIKKWFPLASGGLTPMVSGGGIKAVESAKAPDMVLPTALADAIDESMFEDGEDS